MQGTSLRSLLLTLTFSTNGARFVVASSSYWVDLQGVSLLQHGPQRLQRHPKISLLDAAPAKFLQHPTVHPVAWDAKKQEGKPRLLGLSSASLCNTTACHNTQRSSRVRTPPAHEHSPSPGPVTFAGSRGISARAERSPPVTPRLLPPEGVGLVQSYRAHTVPASVPSGTASHPAASKHPLWGLGLCFWTLQLNKQPRCLLHVVSLIKGENVLCCCSLQTHEGRNIRRLRGRPPAVSRSDVAGEERLQQRECLDQTQITQGTDPDCNGTSD